MRNVCSLKLLGGQKHATEARGSKEQNGSPCFKSQPENTVGVGRSHPGDSQGVWRETHSLGKQWTEPSSSRQTGARREVIWGQSMTNWDRLGRVRPEKT